MLWSLLNLKDRQEFYPLCFFCVYKIDLKSGTQDPGPRDVTAVICPHSRARTQHAERCDKENRCVDVGVKPGLSYRVVFEVITKLHMSVPFAASCHWHSSSEKCHGFSARKTVSKDAFRFNFSAGRLWIVFFTDPCASMSLLRPCTADRKHNYLHIHLLCHVTFTKINLDGLRIPTFLHKVGR